LGTRVVEDAARVEVATVEAGRDGAADAGADAASGFHERKRRSP
jgi:hypothetical protein